MKISLVICSYMRPAPLKACLESLDAKGLAAYGGDLILAYTLNDQATADVMQAYKETAPLPVKIVHTNRRGLSIARNAGIAEASGDIIIFTDDDCLMTPGYIDIVARNMDSGPYGYGGGAVHKPSVSVGANAAHQNIVLAPGTLIHAGVIQGANMFFRKEVFERLGRFREDMGAGCGTAFIGAEDLEMVTRASLAGFTGLLIPDAIITHVHNREIGSAEAQAVNRGYELGRGTHYAWLMMRGVHEAWSLWSATAQPGTDRRVTRETLQRLRREFEGAFEYLKYCLDNNIDLPPE